MCLTIPKQVLSIKKGLAEVKSPQHGIELLPTIVRIKPKDWILSQNGVIISKLSAKEARETTDLYQSKKREGKMETDGLIRLLFFAYGAIKAGKCGDKFFGSRIRSFLLDEESDIDKRFMTSEVKRHLKTAWPRLTMMGPNPLSLANVTRYIMEEHNKFVELGCQTQIGTIMKIKPKKQTLEVSTADGKRLVRYIKPFGEDLRAGDEIAFHYEWLIDKTANLKTLK
jgi:hydrogenase maturation factor